MIARHAGLPPSLILPLTILSRYLYFLSRRRVSASNAHFRTARLAAMQSLCPLLRAENEPALEPVIDLLTRLTASNLFRLAPAIEEQLRPLLPTAPPRHWVHAETPPAGTFEHVQKILLVFGPAIGVGDEILCFPIHGWLRGQLPHASISILSSYANLWPGEDAGTYGTYAELVAHLRGGYDLVVFVDFENPRLSAAIAAEPAVRLYAEIALGVRSAVLVDNDRGLHFQTTLPEAYATNFYEALAELIRWAGFPLATPYRDVDPAPVPRNSRYTILVSPFTSKMDPSELFWARLLALLAARIGSRPVEFVIDCGPNQSTAAFAGALARAAYSCSHGALRCRVITPPPNRGLSFPEIFAEVRRADVVLTADSFLAHAAPMLHRAAIVLASEGVERWRVPSPQSFYFRDSCPVEDTAFAMHRVLSENTQAVQRETTQLHRLSLSVREAFGSATATVDKKLWSELWQACQQVVLQLPGWPSGFETLFADVEYATLLPPWPAGATDTAQVQRHLRSRFVEWQNSNLAKYLGRETAQ